MIVKAGRMIELAHHTMTEAFGVHRTRTEVHHSSIVGNRAIAGVARKMFVVANRCLIAVANRCLIAVVSSYLIAEANSCLIAGANSCLIAGANSYLTGVLHTLIGEIHKEVMAFE